MPNLDPANAAGRSALPVELEQLVRDQAGYSYCPKVNLADLLVPAFLNDFVRKGELLPSFYKVQTNI